MAAFGNSAKVKEISLPWGTTLDSSLTLSLPPVCGRLLFVKRPCILVYFLPLCDLPSFSPDIPINLYGNLYEPVYSVLYNLCIVYW